MEPYASFGRAALLVDSTGELCEALRPALEARGFNLFVSTSALDALRVLVAIEFDVVLCDLQDFGLSRASFEAIVQRAQPSLAGRCLFIAPRGTPYESRDTLLCHRPFDVTELICGLSDLAASPAAFHGAALT
jgi:hypothetical protein